MSPVRFAASAVAILSCLALCQCGAKPSAFGSDVAVTFSPAATARLQALGEKAEVSGFYYGLPVDAVKDKVNDAGQIELGEDQVDIDATSQTVHLSGNGIDPLVLPKVVGAAPRVLISVYTVRKTRDADPLTCTTFDDAVATAHAKPVAIRCDVVAVK
jgi:hypothetical protein